MKTYTKEELTEILWLHRLWINADTFGVRADLSSADLSSANLRYADLRSADLSGSKGLLIGSKWMEEKFKSTEFGYLVYKTFGAFKDSPKDWKIESGSYIEEVVNQNPTNDCGCGINFATLEWIKYNVNKNYDIWECLVEWKDACTITVPYNTDGKARCGRVKLIKIIKP